MVKNKLKNLKYAIPLVFVAFFIIGIFKTFQNSQQGLNSVEYRFWGIFSLSSVSLMLLSFVIFDFVEKRKKSPQKDTITKRIRNFKLKNINVYKLPGVGVKLEALLIIVLYYIYFLVPVDVVNNLFALNSPLLILFVLLMVVGVALIIIGFLSLKIKKMKEPTERDPLSQIQRFVSKGSGTEIDPVIIEPSENLPHEFMVEESNLFIIVRNCYLGRVGFHKCQNIKIENCNIWILYISNCSKVFVNKSTIRRTLSFWENNNIKLEDCDINRVKFIRSNSNTIKNCTINKIKYVYGNDNIFEANIIPEKHLTRIIKKPWFKKGNLKII